MPTVPPILEIAALRKRIETLESTVRRLEELHAVNEQSLVRCLDRLDKLENPHSTKEIIPHVFPKALPNKNR